MLHFRNLGKRYDGHAVFESLGQTMGPGCVALSDENGTGKSTLMQLLAGVLEADTGEIEIDGHSLRDDGLAARARLAYMPDDCLAYPFQTGHAFLELVAAARSTQVGPAARDLAERFQLGPHLDKRFEQMSLGTRKKVFLVSLVLGTPRVVLADEPGNGLDAPARAVLADLFATLGREATVFFTSHDATLIRQCGARTVTFADLAET